MEELQELFEKSPSAEKLKSIKPDVNSTAGQPVAMGHLFLVRWGSKGCNFSKAIGPYQHQLIPSFVFDFLRKALVAQIFQGLCHF